MTRQIFEDNPMHLVVAIPTYNRLQYLKRAINSFCNQLIPDGVRLTLLISNTASTDGTFNFLRKQQTAQSNLVICNQSLEWVGGNYGGILEALPDDADWIWFMGDDDEFSSNKSISKVCNLLLQNHQNKNLAFIHACDEKRSKKTGEVVLDTTFNLCKRFGYLEMLGWFTSLIVRKSEFVSSIQQIHQRVLVTRGQAAVNTPYSAFVHSSYFLQNLHEKDAAFYDEALVQEQKEVDKGATQKRWQGENMGERYLFVVDDFYRLLDQGLPLTDLPTSFFKYHKYHLWDRFITYQIDAVIEVVGTKNLDLVRSYQKQYHNNWARIEQLAQMVGNPEIQKWLVVSARNINAQCTSLFNNPDDASVMRMLQETRKYLTLGCYDYNINFSKTKIFKDKT